MAKSTAHTDKLGSLSDFKAPWESEAGADAEIDKGKLKNLIFNLKRDYALERDKHEDSKVALTEAETARDEAKQQAADGSGAEAQRKIDALTKERDAAQAKVAEFETAAEQADLRKEVLGDFEAENPKAAKYVTGTTKEELEASLEEVKADWGITESEEEGDEDEETDLDKVARTSPRGRSLLNPADRSNGKPGDTEIDFDKVADGILSGGSVFR